DWLQHPALPPGAVAGLRPGLLRLAPDGTIDLFACQPSRISKRSVRQMGPEIAHGRTPCKTVPFDDIAEKPVASQRLNQVVTRSTIPAHRCSGSTREAVLAADNRREELYLERNAGRNARR